MAELNVKIQDSTKTNDLLPKTKAENVFFDDNESLLDKFNNGRLMSTKYYSGVQAMSPIVKVLENTPDRYVIEIKDIEGVIITPNLRGGTESQTAGSFGVYQFIEENWHSQDDGTWLYRIKHSGYIPTGEVFEYDDTTKQYDRILAETKYDDVNTYIQTISKIINGYYLVARKN